MQCNALYHHRALQDCKELKLCVLDLYTLQEKQKGKQTILIKPVCLPWPLVHSTRSHTDGYRHITDWIKALFWYLVSASKSFRKLFFYVTHTYTHTHTKSKKVKSLAATASLALVTLVLCVNIGRSYRTAGTGDLQVTVLCLIDEGVGTSHPLCETWIGGICFPRNLMMIQLDQIMCISFLLKEATATTQIICKPTV